MSRHINRTLLAAPLRTVTRATPSIITGSNLPTCRPSSSLPSVASTDFWKSLVPKPFRREEKLQDDPMIKRVKPKRSKEWNPATFYLVIFLLIGSMSINMIALRQRFDTFMRQSDVRIGLLREVVERIQRGEKVDVERALGTGDAAREQGWDDVLREIERDDAVRKEKANAEAKLDAEAAPRTAHASEALSESPQTQQQQATGMGSFF
ncbi:hypothetical protein HYQ45_014385 [Verticillium longisporum]|uniref:Uncharacterized protein n=1 Tax=Verticillium longisporum TaxID=100787 RepID=A0A0G4LVQ8_VERLO|nr:hypothetical protein HYQ44_013417 [Verticillium longisporum]KAG7121693.1 hypothetical protein HYQ45_014385 [Verticillium longisporum]CRK26161.1 hypothetical protein BN1723_013778 [Verticillium longisporum]CRK29836.1 hypothetical protein BN1708_015681 [Verticillium longisporum]